KQNQRVGSLSSPAVTGGSFGLGNVTSRFVPDQTKVGGGNTGPIPKGVGSSGLKCFNCGEPGHRQSECKKAGKRHLFVDDEWEDNGLADNDYEESPVFDDEPYEEEIFTFSCVKGIDRVSPIKLKDTGNSDSPRRRRITMSERDMLVSSNTQPVSQFNPITGELIMSSANVNFSRISPVVSDKLTDLEKDKANVGKDKALKYKLTDLEKDKVNVGKDKAPKHKEPVKNPAAVVYKARKQKTLIRPNHTLKYI
ncbi:putative reverse transcriptase domain-containing protein, partial [Tanacetum coccineum]